jgi:nucleoid-associated protein YgaU
MSSNQKNVLLGVLVLIIVGMSVYLSRSRTPHTDQTSSSETPSGAKTQQVESESSESDTQISLQQTDDARDQEITTEQEGEDTSTTGGGQSIDDRNGEGNGTEEDTSEQASGASGSSTSSSTNDTTGEGDREANRGTNTYVVKKGDNLRKIAHQFYGSVSAWERILEANSDQLSDTASVEPGMTLIIPEKTAERETAAESENGTDSTQTAQGNTQESTASPSDANQGSGVVEQDTSGDESNRSDTQSSDAESQEASDLSYEGEPPFEAESNQRWYRVKDGESLWEISEKVYGTGKHFSNIWELNKDRIRGYNDLHPGDWLLLPREP